MAYTGCLLRPELFSKFVLTHQALLIGSASYLRNLLHVIQPMEESINTQRAAVGLTLFQPRFSSTAGFHTFKSAAPRFYNKLSLDIKQIEDMKNFKRKLKTYLFSECCNLDDMTIRESYAL